MIKAVATAADGRTAVYLGLSRQNTTRLHDNQPIIVRLRQLHADLPDLDIVLLAGDTEEDIVEDLRVLGRPRPEGGN